MADPVLRPGTIDHGEALEGVELHVIEGKAFAVHPQHGFKSLDGDNFATRPWSAFADAFASVFEKKAKG